MINLKKFSINIIWQILIIDIINLYLRYKGLNSPFLIFIGPALPIFYNYHSFKGKIFDYLKEKYPEIMYEYRILFKILFLYYTYLKKMFCFCLFFLNLLKEEKLKEKKL